MIPISLRIPDELASRLDKETDFEGKQRSQIIRDAIGHYITFLERERFLSKMVDAARALASDTESRTETKDLSECLVDEGLDSLIAAERQEGVESNLAWWK